MLSWLQYKRNRQCPHTGRQPLSDNPHKEDHHEKKRTERDCLGTMEIPDDRYYGIQTTRMLAVSGTAGFPVITYPDMHKALCQIKKACALANAEIGALAPEKRALLPKPATV